MAITKLKPVDVVIVGAGLTGTIAAKELCDAGIKVVALERGEYRDTSSAAMPYAHDGLKYGRRHALMQDLSRETLTFRNRMEQTALPMRQLGSFKPGEGVGGAAVHWGGATWRFLPWDFEMRSRSEARYGSEVFAADCTNRDWGISYNELEPYYDRFEYCYGVSGKAGNLKGVIQPGGNPFEGSRSREYPNPPHPTSHAGHLYEQAAKAMGYHPFPIPAATASRPFKNIYGSTINGCVHCGYCSSYACEMGAKGNVQSAVLPVLMGDKNFELRTHARVMKVNLDSSRKRAVSVTYVDAQGREFEQPAELILLMSYVFGNVRLMLLSGIGEPYDPVANRGVVGRNYAYQVVSRVNLNFEDKIFNQFMGAGGMGISIDDFNGDNYDHSGLGFVGGGRTVVATGGLNPIESRPVPHDTPRWGAAWKKAVAQYFNRSFDIGNETGCNSYRTNYLDLDRTYCDAWGLPLLRMTFDWRDNEHRASAFITGKMAEIAKRIGAEHVQPEPRTGRYTIVPYQSTHNTGGASMGLDPGTSAVNKYLQSWDVSNVFVIGANAFPQNAGYNPTDTVGALTYWTLDAIKNRYLKRPGALA